MEFRLISYINVKIKTAKNDVKNTSFVVCVETSVVICYLMRFLSLKHNYSEFCIGVCDIVTKIKQKNTNADTF